MIVTLITYAILAITGLIGSGIATDEMRKANHNSPRKQAASKTESLPTTAKQSRLHGLTVAGRRQFHRNGSFPHRHCPA